MTARTLPAITADSGLTHYLQEINKFPMLEEQEEYMLAKAWREHGDVAAAHKLVTSHLRLVAKIAMNYRGYGLPVAELISEGNIGLMQAVKRFEPDKGFRLATYAMWWIKASIQEFILRSWSLVKIGTTAAQKKLFFNLRKLKNLIKRNQEGNLKPEEITEIATLLNVPEQDVIDMEQRMSQADYSLNKPISDDEGASEWRDYLEDGSANQENWLGESEDYEQKQYVLENAMKQLNDRERHIIKERRLKEVPTTLEELSQHYNISRERVRQIENRAMEKLQHAATAA